jgi:hypothetical protein
MSARARAFVIAVLCGGLISGTIDIGSAVLVSGKSFVYILHAIAGGLLANDSFAGGTNTAILGLVLQELMSLLIAAIYVGASILMPTLRRSWFGWGLAYGVVVFFVMNYVVVPLSAWHHTPHFSTKSFVGNLLAMLLYGLIIAFFASRPVSAALSAKPVARNLPNAPA